MSAKTTEMVRLTSPGAAVSGGGVVDGPWPTAAPQASQNFAPGLSSVPQLGQAEASAAPHSSQKRAPSRFSWPQWPQIRPPINYLALSGV
jgi:hypothetical protein